HVGGDAQDILLVRLTFDGVRVPADLYLNDVLGVHHASASVAMSSRQPTDARCARTAVQLSNLSSFLTSASILEATSRRSSCDSRCSVRRRSTSRTSAAASFPCSFCSNSWSFAASSL